MSTRSNRRISRELLLGLAAMFMLAVVFWAYNLGKGRGAADAASRGPHPVVASAGESSVTPPTPSAPAVAPATQPAPQLTATPAAPAVAAGATPAAPVATAIAPITAVGAKPAPTPSAPILGAIAETPVAQGATTRPTAAAQLAAHAGAERSAAPDRSAERLTGAPLVDAKSRIDAAHLDTFKTNPSALNSAKLLDARSILNAAMASGALSGPDTAAAKRMLSDINAVVIFSPRKFAEEKEINRTFDVPSGAVLTAIARRFDVTPELLMRLNNLAKATSLKAGANIKTLQGPFNAIVDKSDFTLELWAGEPGAKSGVYLISFPVGLGKDDGTPTGTWAVENKLTNPAYYSPRGEGIIAADDPKNPLGEYWISLVGTDGAAVGKSSYGIHGTIDPASIGKMESLGCIRLTNENVARVYEMLVSGKSTVTVRE